MKYLAADGEAKGYRLLDYREWMIGRIENYTEKISQIRMLPTEGLEKLYERIVGKNPQMQFKMDKMGG